MKRRMSAVSWAGWAAAMALLSAAPRSVAAEAATEPSAVAVAELGWMAGHWTGRLDGDVSEEIWSAPAAGSMVGVWRWASGDEVKLFELLTITGEPTGPVLRLRHFDARLKGWEEKDAPLALPLSAHGDGWAAFEGPGSGGPVRITYRRDGDDALVAVLEKTGGTSEFRYRRQGTLSAPGQASFTDEAWAANRDVYREILLHPFLRGLQDGSLDRRAFAFYMIQDAEYLRAFAVALEAAANKAPRLDWAELLRTHARDTVAEERRLHASVFEEYGISAEEREGTEPAPEASGYMSFLVATAYSRPFGESIAALLPCYWIYGEVGKELAARGSSDPVYQRWIDAYSGDEYGRTVEAVKAIADEMARRVGPDERGRMLKAFRTAARYEWMFWDSAYARRAWPPAAR
jgi:thiaminase (transcriptional activator TenA)